MGGTSALATLLLRSRLRLLALRAGTRQARHAGGPLDSSALGTLVPSPTTSEKRSVLPRYVHGRVRGVCSRPAIPVRRPGELGHLRLAGYMLRIQDRHRRRRTCLLSSFNFDPIKAVPAGHRGTHHLPRRPRYGAWG